MPDTEAPPARRSAAVPDVSGVLAAAVKALGGQERSGQIEMAEQVAAGARRRQAPPRPGRHRHRQVAGLPRPQPAPPRPGRGRHRDAGPPAPAGRAGHPEAGRGDRRPGSTRRTPCSRAAATTPACTASARACPTSRARWSTCPPARWPRRCSSCGRGPRRSPRTPARGERDNAPRHTDREWRQVSVNHRECLGADEVPVRRRSASPSAPGRRRSAPT